MFDSLEIRNENYEFIQNYDTEIQDWLENIDAKAEVPFNQSPLTFEDFAHFDRSLLFGFTNREFVLTLLKLTTPSSQINQVYTTRIRHPPDYIFGTSDFKINLFDHYIEKSPIQYISNVDAFMMIREADEILKLSSREEYENIGHLNGYTRKVYKGRVLTPTEFGMLLREATLMKNFAIKYATSRRLLPVYKLIQVVIESSNFDPIRGFPWKKNPILGALSYLYDGYNDFPYREVEKDTVFLESASMILPEITFALIELWIKYLMIDMTPCELMVGINSQLEWATTSLDAKLLAFKDSRVNINKVLIDQTIQITGITHGYKSIKGIVTEYAPREIWMEEDRQFGIDFQEYETEFLSTCPIALRNYLIERKILTEKGRFTNARVIPNLTELKRLYTVINVITQHGLFIKNPVVLTMTKSILPRASIAFACPATDIMYNQSIFTAKLPLHLGWDDSPIFREMLYEGRKVLEAYHERFNHLNLEEEFIKALTNNSGGVDYQPTNEEKVDIPESILRTFGKKRLMYFLLNPILYESFPDWINALKSVTNSGERKQVDRRGRVIQMVSNAAQLGPFLLFLWVDIMGKKEPELSSKKNTGGINDINALLRSTSNIYGIQESADISGMDASTTRVATSFINGLLIELLQKCDHDKYFFSRRMMWDIFQKEDGVEKFKEAVPIHPGVPVLQISESVGESFNYRLNIPELSAYGTRILMDTSPQVFPSGKFSTNAQHSLLNMLVLRVLKRRLILKSLQHRIPIFQLGVKVSGDDIFASFELRVNDDKACREFSQSLVTIFTEIGFKIGSLLSRYSATFLQQSAVFGTVLPKPDRISLTTSERGDSLKLGVFDAFSELRDITKELSSRVHYPSSTRGFLFLVANQLRRVRVDISDVSKDARATLESLRVELITRDQSYAAKCGFDKSLIPYRLILGKSYVHLILPLMALFISGGFDLPFPSSALLNYVPASNIFTPRGSISDWKMRKVLLKKGRHLTDYTLESALQTSFNVHAIPQSKTRDMIHAVRKTEEKLMVSMTQYLQDLYDNDLANFLGLDWLKHFQAFNVKEVLERLRLAKFPKSIRDEWADRLKFRLNFDAIIRSRLAGLKLSAAGFKLSKRLAFYNSPNERITQAITSGGDSALEFKIHRLELLFHMMTFKIGQSWRRDVDYEVALLCDYEVTSKTLSISRDFIIDVHGQLMLSSGLDRDRDIILYKFGHNLYDLSVQFSGYYALAPGPFKDYKHEELVKFAAHVRNTQPTMLKLVWEFANVHERYQRELERIIEFGEAQELSEWKSIIHTRQVFELSTSIRHIQRLWDFEYLNDNRINRMTYVIMRDMAYSENALWLTKGRFKYSQAMLLIHGGMRSKLNSLIKTTLQHV
uniref:RNA-dependent RNA polymerase n=1 Tax=Shelly beach virus TaxID=2485878 RepID=A0A3G3BTK1_9VIRU|nr:RNA-dependent RNA polymerase [Shelly beach virus]